MVGKVTGRNTFATMNYLSFATMNYLSFAGPVVEMWRLCWLLVILEKKL